MSPIKRMMLRVGSRCIGSELKGAQARAMRAVEHCRIRWLAAFLAVAVAGPSRQIVSAEAADNGAPKQDAQATANGRPPRGRDDQIRAMLSLSTAPRDAALLPTETPASRDGQSLFHRRQRGPLALTPTWATTRTGSDSTHGEHDGSADERTDITSPGLMFDVPLGKSNLLSLRYRASFTKKREYMVETDTQAQSLSAEAKLRLRNVLTLRLGNDLSRLAWHAPGAEPPYRYAYGDSNANLDWRVSRRWTLGTELRQRSTDTASGEEPPILATTIAIDSTYKLTGRLSLLSAGSVTGDRLADRLAFQTAPEDMTKTGSIGLDYQPTRRVRTELTYGFGWKRTSLPTQDTLESSLKLSLSIGF